MSAKQDDLPGTTETKTEAKPEASLDVVALQKRLAAYEAAEAKRALDAKAADEAAARKAKEDGDIKAQLDLAQKKLQELESLSPDAELGRKYREREQARIAKSIESMTAEQRELVEAQPTVDMKARMVDFITQQSTGQAGSKQSDQKRDAPKGGAPAGSPINFQEAFKDPEKWAEAKRLDPEGAKAARRAAFAAGQRRPLAFLNTNSQGN